jgi:glycosyltransferase involved in cell wall biosynthesis
MLLYGPATKDYPQVPRCADISDGAQCATRDVRDDQLPSICIVAHNAYAAVTNSKNGHIGGVEHQTSMLAKWLVRSGFRVSLLTWDEGDAARTEVKGVRLLPICPKKAGLPGVRFLHPRWSGLWRALRAADADVYYHNGAEATSGQIALWCKRYGRRFVFSSAADADVDVTLPALTRRRDRWLYRRALHVADAIIVQTLKQQKMLKEGFGLASTALPMPCDGPTREEYKQRSSPGSPRALWIGRISTVKRLEWLVELAERCPGIDFDIVGPIENRKYAEPILNRARALNNVVWHGRKLRHEVSEMYQRAACLICTSLREGFPNTFLEAWSYGVPVISTLDVDHHIEKLGLGTIATDLKSLERALNTITSDTHIWRLSSERARAYFEHHHTTDIAMTRFAECFVRVTQ